MFGKKIKNLTLICIIQGRILNRFSKDVGSMDELLPETILETLQIFLNLIAILIIVSIMNYWMIIGSVALLLMLYLIQRLFSRTIHSLKTIEGVGKLSDCTIKTHHKL